jgi:16S rRNA (cytosine1402-N4)-methyltransferase
MKNQSIHIPVLLQEVIDLLNPMSNGVYIDGTLGGGGHTEALVRQVGQTITVISMDRDVSAIDKTELRLRNVLTEQFETTTIETTTNFPIRFPVRFVHANYQYFDEVLDLLKIEKIDGFLLDLGLSSDQLANQSRGFSFEATGTLDLRFDTTEGETASELLARLREKEIADLIYQFGEERYSRRIAKAIIERREKGTPIQTAADLADLVRHCVPREKKTKLRSVPIDPATRTFQAIRIAVNDELGSLQNVLQKTPERMKSGGVMVIISFHSLEDRIVKNAFRDDPRWELITKKPIVSSEEEVERNPRARSAKLRAARRV